MKQLFSILLLLACIISACSPAPTPLPTEIPIVQSAAEPVETEVVVSSPTLFQIVKADGTKFDVTLDAVKSLPLAQITVDGKVQEGPKLLDVLSLAGITDFTEITITGSGKSILTREQVDDNTILDFSNRGTMKLATTYIPKAEWAKDITEITVK